MTLKIGQRVMTLAHPKYLNMPGDGPGTIIRHWGGTNDYYSVRHDNGKGDWSWPRSRLRPLLNQEDESWAASKVRGIQTPVSSTVKAVA